MDETRNFIDVDDRDVQQTGSIDPAAACFETSVSISMKASGIIDLAGLKIILPDSQIMPDGG